MYIFRFSLCNALFNFHGWEDIHAAHYEFKNIQNIFKSF